MKGKYMVFVSSMTPATLGITAHPSAPPMINIDANRPVTLINPSAYKNPVANEFDIEAPNTDAAINAYTFDVIKTKAFVKFLM